MGVNDTYLTIRNQQVERGEFFSAADIHTAAKVCVIGQTVAENLFPGMDCVGATIRIKKIPFRVIGLLEAKGANLFGQDQDNIVLARLPRSRKR